MSAPREVWLPQRKGQLRKTADGTVYRRLPSGAWKKVAYATDRRGPTREMLRDRALAKQRERCEARHEKRARRVKRLEPLREKAARMEVRRLAAHLALIWVALLGLVLVA